MDKGTVAGIVVSFGGITAGLLLEGGKLAQILQPTAALIVAGGTVGAVLLQFPLSTVFIAVRSLRDIFFEPRSESMLCPDAVCDADMPAAVLPTLACAVARRGCLGCLGSGPQSRLGAG